MDIAGLGQVVRFVTQVLTVTAILLALRIFDDVGTWVVLYRGNDLCLLPFLGSINGLHADDII